MSEPNDGKSISPGSGASEKLDVQSLLDEQAAHWQRGEHIRVEDYLARHPRLQADHDGLVDLITNEFLLRRQAGEKPTLEEYRQRFPHLAGPLALQFEIEQAIDEETLVVGDAQPPRSLFPSAPPAVPGYKILGELGRGSMGVVYKARQTKLNRLVALKMILAGNLAGTEQRVRFLAEAEAIAALKHPGIVGIYDFGTCAGLPYFSLEFCEGGSLADRLAGKPLPIREAAGIVEQVARAIQAAHQRGIVHRDLKPGNILLTEDGTPMVTDFGLARRLEVGACLTATGSVLGTPSYMAPEQASGKTKEMGPAADVYSLGAILYECLTGRPPFKAATLSDTLQQVVNDEPLPPRQRNAEVPAELDTICLKCLNKEPDSRFQSAAELADELRQFLTARGVVWAAGGTDSSPVPAARTVVDGGTVLRFTGASADSVREMYDFLAPSRGPNEIGWLGRYRILRPLGAGGMGVVFECEDTDLKRRVALKVLRPALAASASSRKRFLHEGQAAAALVHDRVVPIHHVGEDRGIPFLAMPLLVGETLEDRLLREKLPPLAEVLRIGREIAEGLAAAHARGLIHRDIKPSNIWLEGEGGHVRLLDFGLARAVGGDSHLTRSGVVVGTPAYMAPEQARGEEVDHRADLFSLGCVLYRACTDKLPFPGTNALATLLALAQHTPPPPAKLNPQLPPGLSELIMRLLARRAEDRYPSAEAVTEALDAVASGRAVPRQRFRRPVIALAALVLLGVLGVVGYRAGLGVGPRPEPAEDATQQGELFNPAVHHAAGMYPISVAVADLNGDGKEDLVVVNSQSRTVSVLLGKGDGSFGPPRTVKAGDDGPWFAGSVKVADLNGDGKPDLIVTDTAHQVSVLLGKGDGSFEPPVRYAAGNTPNSVAVGDFNGDGKPDLAVANGDGTISILLGQGHGTFREAVHYRAGKSLLSVVVADFNGDGKLDLVVAGSNISILLGKGDGNFEKAVSCSSAGRCGALAVGDFNGDGKLDIAFAGPEDGMVSILLGRGNGAFRPAGNYLDGTSTWSWAVVSADVNGDGIPDIVTANDKDGGSVCVLLGNGDGSFQKALRYHVGKRPRSLAVGDFNGDGALDLVVANYDSNNVSVLLNGRLLSYRAHFGAPMSHATGMKPRGVAVADLDRDGKPDLIVADYTGRAIRILRGTGDGTFEDSGPSYPAGKGQVAGSNFDRGGLVDIPAAVAVGDFDRDGWLDVVVADSPGDAVCVLRGTGGGRFGRAVSHAVGKNPVAVAVADLDRDGKLDIVTANYDSGTVSVLRGRGDGSFCQAVHYPCGGQPHCVVMADLNGDGNPDLVVANRFHVGSVTVLLGKGDGTFAAPVAHPVGSFPVALVVADFNRDGKLDLAVANWGLNDINVLLGNGDGTFRPAVNYPAHTGYPVAMVSADVNGDGKIDLVLAGSRDNTMSILLGKGDGTFQFGGTFPTGVHPLGLAVGHFQGKGWPDLVTANARSGDICVLPNRPAAPSLRIVSSPEEIETIDLEGMTFRVLVEALDRGNQAEAGYTGSVRFSSSDPRAVLPADYTFVPTDKGQRVFTIKFRTPGSQSVAVTDVRGQLIPGSAAVWVFRSTDLRLELEAPTSVTAGKPFSGAMSVFGPYGQWSIRGYGGRVRFHCTDAGATLPADYTWKREERYYRFRDAFTLPALGKWTIRVTDTALPQLTSTATVTVRPGS
jgi:serine/threonine protein kinase